VHFGEKAVGYTDLHLFPKFSSEIQFSMILILNFTQKIEFVSTCLGRHFYQKTSENRPQVIIAAVNSALRWTFRSILISQRDQPVIIFISLVLTQQ